jgi:oligopeptide/dipeptide ABC transporter ATP-binding protein
MTTPSLRVDNLQVEYTVGKRKLRAVNGVSFEINAGETLGLVGESGSGKSTTGLALLRLIDPAGGNVRLGDTDVTALKKGDLRALRKRMQIVFQDPYSSLNPSMTIGQLLEEPLVIHAKLSGAERRAQVAAALVSVGLTPAHAARYPHEFSGGQRQRVAIARSMMVRPELVVLDEPVSALDVSTQSQIINLLRKIQGESNAAFLFVAHDLAVVRLMSQNVAVMYLGEIVEQGPSARVYDQPAHPYTAALISAVPVPDPARAHAPGEIILRGDLPSPLDPPSGCRFRTRCPFAMQVCGERPPPPIQVAGGGTTACHLHQHGPALGGKPLGDFLRLRGAA